jgi:pyruvate dehydrogenase E2 component (dihydrolipoamide acetyltransferase)
MPAVTMPKLSDSMEEGVIIHWLADDGAEVAVGTELAEIETDKATLVFESELTGTLRIVADAGQPIAVGAPIAHVLAPGEAVPASRAVAAVPDAAAADVGSAGAGRHAGSGNGRRIGASPVARRLAVALRVDLDTLAGTGPAGRIVKRDVLDAAARAPAVSEAPGGGTPPIPAGGVRGEITVQRLTGVQATIARRMTEAKASMPEFTLEAEVDMDASVSLREQLKRLGDELVPSYNDFVVRACALALRAHPSANAAFRGGEIERYARVNVGVAVAVAGSLVVPIVFDADRRSLGEIARATRRFAQAARERTLAPAELDGGTFSVSNLGMFGVRRFTAVLNPPQAAILAVGSLEQRPVVRDGALAVGHRMAIVLTCDHRVIYGADAAALLAEIRANLEAPLRLTL